ncbi:peptide chain release factor N(5)-glutamine methyltransferase [Variovorax sp. PBL-E5]|uniref:peptide chain release factor N(5)-glutamine methyltransferase n=1 Tax=Variovorax sp. PBL-E5 TaxID=434014 RepID=UPI00131976E5|nr:peptide chain release factor N(5)-glutamine methyltransferase [Variovorax sp. PBL-E5]VTU21412.1 Release factor glutamine methyltransferase [Variovorax sp. PBL-E5]
MTPGTPAPATAAEMLAAAAALGLDRLDAQLLLLHALGRSADERAWLIAHDTDALSDAVWPAFSRLCARRAAGEPLAYLVGEKEFHGLRLQVDARVLVPRPDTETLVDWALQCLDGLTAPSVLDLGTGSGAIALAIGAARADAWIGAVDASAGALAVARANALRLGLAVHFIERDWLAGADAGYDLIVSNPPYIAAGDAHLPALMHEPSQALVSGIDGLDDIRRIVQAAPGHLKDGGWLLLEHGHDQAAAVRNLLALHGFAEVQSRNDLAGIARCSGGILRSVK